ncbi:tctex1 domain-containing protein 2 [Trichonephila clavipes]|nr:tctex1 domain-containing protein 2 [Trichonephila clavipes]
MIVQFRNEKVSNHGSIPITIDCNVVAFVVFEEGFHQPIKRTKHCVTNKRSIQKRIPARNQSSDLLLIPEVDERILEDMSEEKQLNIRPSSEQKFNPETVRSALKELVTEELGEKGYDYVYAPDWTKSLSRRIHDKLKSLLSYERYKFAVQVVIGEKHGQGMRAASGCLWDEDTDGCASVVVSKETMYCIVSVYAVYCYCYE